MASFLYDRGRQAFAEGDIAWKAAGGSTIKCALIDVADYTANQADDLYWDESGGAKYGLVDTAETLTSLDATDGICNAADATFTEVSASGVTNLSALTLFRDNGGAETTWPMIAYIEFTQVVPNGGNITIQWDNTSSVYIFKL